MQVMLIGAKQVQEDTDNMGNLMHSHVSQKDTISQERIGVNGSANMLTNQKSIKQEFDVRNVKVVSPNVKMSKKTKKSHSKILKCIVSCLESERFLHVLKWKNREEKEFEIVFVHKNNPEWNSSYLDLFKHLDGLSAKKRDNYKKKPSYESDCKVRCKSNLRKLCEAGVLSKSNRGRNYRSNCKSYFSMCYKINDTLGIYLPHLNKTITHQKRNASVMTMLNQNAQGTFEDRDNELFLTSHFPCLSNQETIPQESVEVTVCANSANETISLEWVEATVSANSANVINQRTVKKEDFCNAEPMFKHGVRCNYEQFSDGSLYQTAQETFSLGTNRVNNTHVGNGNVYETTASPERLGVSEVSFNFNNLNVQSTTPSNFQTEFYSCTRDDFIERDNLIEQRKTPSNFQTEEFYSCTPDDLMGKNNLTVQSTTPFNFQTEEFYFSTRDVYVEGKNLIVQSTTPSNLQTEGFYSSTRDVYVEGKNLIVQSTTPSNSQFEEFYSSTQDGFIERNCLERSDLDLGMFEDPSIVDHVSIET